MELCFVYPSNVSVEELQQGAEELCLLAQGAVVLWKPLPYGVRLLLAQGAWVGESMDTGLSGKRDLDEG